MDKRKAWTRKELAERTRKGLAIVERGIADTRAGDGFCRRSFLARALEASIAQERGHRGYGRRMADDGSPRPSVKLAATAMVLRSVTEGRYSRKRPTWTDVAETREDCALAYAIRECLPKAALRALRALGWAEFDYVLDIAGVTL
ncbi:MAG: hypothetical protein FJ298_16075 [Planctomycetes bacterium]|nr:hypothetical protein [Planctomycetota bacterium]